MTEKRITAHILPYTRKDGEIIVYLQKRSADSERNPGFYSIFGGGVENGETPETAMLREAREELHFVPSPYSYLGEYADDYSVSHYYFTEVAADFEKNIRIDEGEYGKFFSKKDIQSEQNISDNTKRVLNDLFKKVTP